jgi:hypothetical protein
MALPDEVLFDVRLIDRHLLKGQTNGKDYQKWLKAQEDLSEGAVTVDYDLITATGAQRNKKVS